MIFENLIFEATEEDIDEAIQIYDDNSDRILRDSVYPLIAHAAIVRPFCFPQLKKLWAHLGTSDDTFQYSLFLEYLIKLGIQPESSIQDENIYCPIDIIETFLIEITIPPHLIEDFKT